MPKEKSVGAVVFRREGNCPKFLLLHYNAGHWGFPKGHIEPGETEKHTILREVEEETALTKVGVVPGFRRYTKYFFKQGQETVFKEVIFLLAESKEGRVKLSHEHQVFEWLPFQEAMQRLSFKNTRQVLQEAGNFLRLSNPG